VGTMAVQICAHAAAGLNWQVGADSRLVGPPNQLSSFFSALSTLIRWYACAGAMLTLALLPVGLWFFRGEASRTNVAFFWPWIFVVGTLLAYLPLVPMLCALEGAGRLRQVQRMRFAQACGSAVVAWALIPTSSALVALAVASMLQLSIAAAWLMARYGNIVRCAVQNRPTAEHGAARRSILRAQTWTGVNWVVALIGSQALTPIVFRFQGSDVAGRVGLSLALTTAPLTLSISWLQSRYPEYGRLAARFQTSSLKVLAKRATAAALTFCIVGEVVVVAVVYCLKRYAPAVGSRFLDWAPLFALGAANVGFLIYQAVAGYLRANREESILPATIMGTTAVVGLCTVAATTHLVSPVYMFTAAVGLVWVPVSFAILRMRGHHAESSHGAPDAGRL